MPSRLTCCTTIVCSWGLLACGAARDKDSVESSQNSLSNLTVTGADDPVYTSGVATNAPPSGNQPDVCSNLGVTCQQFDLNVQLPNNIWHAPGGVQVAIRWATDDDAIDLYVYKDGVQVAKAEGFFAAISESLR